MEQSKPTPTATAALMQHHTLKGAGALSLAVTEFEPAAGLGKSSSVVFAHGFGQTRSAWMRSGLTLAASGYAGLSYDARGHGGSAHNPKQLAYAADQFVDDMMIVAGTQTPPPVLVGASMGGLFGMLAEARWPRLFRAMVLVDITPRWETAGAQRILSFMTAYPQGFDSLAHAADVIATYLPHRRARKSNEALRDLLRQGDDHRWRWHWDPRLIEELMHGNHQHQEHTAQAATQLRCPILLISGGRSDLVSDRTVEEFQQLVPHATHLRLPEATHMVAGDDNDAFANTVLQYLAHLPPALTPVTPKLTSTTLGDSAAVTSDPGASL